MFEQKWHPYPHCHDPSIQGHSGVLEIGAAESKPLAVGEGEVIPGLPWPFVPASWEIRGAHGPLGVGPRKPPGGAHSLHKPPRGAPDPRNPGAARRPHGGLAQGGRRLAEVASSPNPRGLPWGDPALHLQGDTGSPGTAQPGRHPLQTRLQAMTAAESWEARKMGAKRRICLFGLLSSRAAC